MAGKSTNERIQRARALRDRSRNAQQKAVLLNEVAKIRDTQRAELVDHSVDLCRASTELRRKAKRRN